MQGPQRIRARFVTSCKSLWPLCKGQTSAKLQCQAWLCWMDTKPYPVPAALGEAVKFSRSVGTHSSFPGSTRWEISPGARAGQGEAAGSCRAPRVLLESAKCFLEQPSSSGVCTKGNPSLQPRGFCAAGNPTGGFPWELNPGLILEDFCTTDNPKMYPQGLHHS